MSTAVKVCAKLKNCISLFDWILSFNTSETSPMQFEKISIELKQIHNETCLRFHQENNSPENNWVFIHIAVNRKMSPMTNPPHWIPFRRCKNWCNFERKIIQFSKSSKPWFTSGDILLSKSRKSDNASDNGTLFNLIIILRVLCPELDEKNSN